MAWPMHKTKIVCTLGSASESAEVMDEILGSADGIMIARGDLGVEIPIEQIAVVQKRLMRGCQMHHI